MNKKNTFHTIILGFVFLSLFVPNNLWGQKIFETFSHDRKHRYTGKTTYEFDIDPSRPMELIIEKVQGDIYIQGTNSMTVHIEEKINIKSSSRKKAEQRFEGFRATVAHHAEENTVSITGTNEWPSRISYSYDISIPTTVSIMAYTSGGDIELSLITGEVDIRTSGGDIDIEHVEGKLTGKTSGGDIDLRHGIGNVYLATSGGDIDIQNLEGKLNVHTSGGDIDVNDTHGNVKVSTSGGDIHFTSISGNEIDGRTSGGNIHADEITGDLVIITSGGDLIAEDVRGIIRGNTSGGDIDLDNVTGNISVTTSGGDIRAERIHSGISASTTSGDLHIEKTRVGPDEIQNIDLNTSFGDIYLSIPEDISASIDALVKKGEDQKAIDCEFPLTIVNKHNDVEAFGIFGDGKHTIKLRNSYGHIIIERN